MFSDTHFHLIHVTDGKPEIGSSLFEQLSERKVFFAQDIGTHCDDLSTRQNLVAQCIQKMAGGEKAKSDAEKFLYFSAGIWPSPEEIKGRCEGIRTLENQIEIARKSDNPLFRKVSAIGECGLDRHWNPAGVDGRSEADFDKDMAAGEIELFELQLDLGRRLNLPVVIHSRDAFDATLCCIKNVGYDNGIIHCYSYGKEEARSFLDRGWYISFSGSITYTKKSHLEEMGELLKFVPKERILIETDAPYLAPVPERGKPNSPVFIDNTYKYAAAARGVAPENLSETVDDNVRKLFFID